MKRKPNAANRAKFTLGLATKGATTAITTAVATGMEGTAADRKMIIVTVTTVHASMINMCILTRNARKTVPCITGRVMVTATTETTCVGATGTAETAVATAKRQPSSSMPIARNACASTRPCLTSAMGNAKCSVGVEMAIATTKITTAAAIGMVETVVDSRVTYTVQTVVAETRTSKEWCVQNRRGGVVSRDEDALWYL